MAWWTRCSGSEVSELPDTVVVIVEYWTPNSQRSVSFPTVHGQIGGIVEKRVLLVHHVLSQSDDPDVEDLDPLDVRVELD